VLGKREALESARALIAMPKAEYDRLQSALVTPARSATAARRAAPTRTPNGR